mmetsp:Transcript_15802/g.34206  ORF Transcript_15802/g.34206 Transcript_15802/m.34206 type:complete len:122 (+) Transcript_15802:689-1054(+)
MASPMCCQSSVVWGRKKCPRPRSVRMLSDVRVGSLRFTRCTMAWMVAPLVLLVLAIVVEADEDVAHNIMSTSSGMILICYLCHFVVDIYCMISSFDDPAWTTIDQKFLFLLHGQRRTEVKA